MRRLLWAGALTVSALAASLIGIGGASAVTTYYCNGSLPPGTYGIIVVLPNEECYSDGGITVNNGLYVGPGATLVIGNAENPGDNGTINGGVHAANARNVQLHFLTINGGVSISGGAGPYGGPFYVTWNAIEDNTIRGGVSMIGYNGFWSGFIRNNVTGNVVLAGNQVEDPDGNEFVTNRIKGSLVCYGNSPAPQVGDSGGGRNAVSGQKLGQCFGL